MKINLFCRMGQSGVGRHAKYIFDNLRQLGMGRIDVIHADLDDKNALARAITATTEEDRTLFFVTQDPKLLQMIKGKKILWCAFEASHMPKKLIALMDLFDEIWAPSHWGAEVMAASGLAAAKIKVMQEGVDSEIYFPQLLQHDNFTFLSVGKYEKRKAIDEVIEAFTQEFSGASYHKVFLKLKSDFPLFPERIDELKKKIEGDSRIKLVEGYKADIALAALYNGADAFVFPSRAEGFGLPCLEAIACGVPLIATHYSGQTEYLDKIADLYVPSKYVMEPIEDKDFDYFYKDLYDGEAYGEWASPDIESLRQAMRQVYENYEEWKQKASTASGIVRESFDWKIAAGKALAELEK